MAALSLYVFLFFFTEKVFRFILYFTELFKGHFYAVSGKEDSIKSQEEEKCSVYGGK